MSRSLCIQVLLLAGVVMAVAGSPAGADWLVTVDGHRVETRGEWRIEGDLVLFDAPGGGLVSMRASEVDLDASREATATAAAGPEEATTADEPRKSVYSLTDADVRHVKDEAAPLPDAESDGAPVSEDGALTVTNWSDDTETDAEGIHLVGTLSNQGPDTAANMSVGIRLYDVDGSLIVTGAAELAKLALPPGGTSSFEATFEGVFDYSAVRFEVDSVSLSTEQPADPDAEPELPIDDA